MRAPYVLIASLTLAGCTNAPSTSDIERVLETAVASCQNIELADVKKTNGYEKDGYYRVEYTYSLQLKNQSGLTKLKKAWLEEKDRDAEYIPARDAHERQVREVEDEIAKIESSFAEKRPDEKQFSTSGRPFWAMPDHERRAWDAAQSQWQSERYAATEAKRKELDELKRAWSEERAKVPRPTVFRNEGNVMHAFFSQGCSQAGWRYASGLFDAHAEVVSRANADAPPGALRDMSHWFEEQNALMTGVMTMRKTENGWQAVSEAL